MTPALCDGDLVLVWRADRTFRVGDVICYKAEDETTFARIAAASGDSVSIDNEHFLVNGYLTSRSMNLSVPADPLSDLHYPLVPETDSWFLLHDNVSVFGDSRTVGAAASPAFIGKVIGLWRCRTI